MSQSVNYEERFQLSFTPTWNKTEQFQKLTGTVSPFHLVSRDKINNKLLFPRFSLGFVAYSHCHHRRLRANLVISSTDNVWISGINKKNTLGTRKEVVEHYY